jgi:hypothetical protein
VQIKEFFIIATFIIVSGISSCKKENSQPSSPPSGKKWIVTTIAGDGTKGYNDGPYQSAKFNAPIDVTVTKDGTLFIADLSNHRIRKIAGGQVTTYTGNDTFGLVNGHGVEAQFKSPYRIALDAVGNMYLLDEGTPVIRKISTTADVSVFAGAEIPGYLNGSALTARFQSDEGAVIADQSGNIYIGDTFNNIIRKISSDGQVSTLAGTGVEGFRNGNADSAQFRFPVGIVFDKQGNIYIADEGNFCIRKITSDGLVSTFSGSGINGNADGAPATAQFNIINDMVGDSQGNLYVADENRIRKVTPQGVVLTIAGSSAGYMDGDGVSAKFNGIGGLGIDAQDNLYLADIVNNRIRKISFQ